MDYDDNDEHNEDDGDETYHEEDDNDENKENEQELDPIDQGEIKDIILDTRGDHNPTTNNGTKPEEPGTDQHEDEQDEPTKRLTCQTRPIERLEPTMTGKVYMQTNKVTFKSNKYTRLEYYQPNCSDKTR